MPHVLVLTVGGSPDPIIHAIQQCQPKPALVAFLCSSGKEPAASINQLPAITTKTQLSERDYLAEAIANTDQLDLVMEACERIASQARARLGEDLDFTANYTGGTKTMSAGLVLYATFADPPWQVQLQTGPRRDLVRTTAGDRARYQDMRSVASVRLLELAHRLEERHQFAAALDVVANALDLFPIGHARGDQMQADCQRLQVLDAMARFDYQSAAKLLSQFGGELARTHMSRVRQLIATLDALDGDAPWPAKNDGLVLIEELLDNAGRCAAQARYDDAFSRLYRACELLAQLQLRRRFGLSTGNLDLDAPCLNKEQRAHYRQLADPSGRVKLGLKQAYDLLAQLGDPLGSHAPELRLDSTLVRNASWLAHGFTPVTEELWRSKGNRWLQWLTEAIKLARSAGA